MTNYPPGWDWGSIELEVYSMILQPWLKGNEAKVKVVQFDSASDIPIREQKLAIFPQIAMLMQTRKFKEAVLLCRAYRSVPPQCPELFGSPLEGPFDELCSFRWIYEKEASRQLELLEMGQGMSTTTPVPRSETSRDSSNGTDLEMNPRENPLENGVVLCHLFQFLSAKMMKDCRRVSKNWYTASISEWQKQRHITFRMEAGQILLVYHGRDTSEQSIPLAQFIQHATAPVSPLRTHPFNNIWMQRCGFGSERDGDAQLALLWETVGKNLATLRLDGCEFRGKDELCRLIFDTCPNLKRLDIIGCDFAAISQEERERSAAGGRNVSMKTLNVTWNGQNGKIPISWLDIFQHFPRISSLSIVADGKIADGADVDGLIQAVMIIREREPNFLPFKNINLGAIPIPGQFMNEERLKTIKRTSFPIRKLMFSEKRAIEDEFPLLQAIQTFQNTTEEIRVETVVGGRDPGSTFPYGLQLDQLKRFSVRGIFCHDLSFLRSMPNLETLTLDSSYCTDNDWEVVYLLDINVRVLREPASTPFVMGKLTTLTIRHHFRIVDFSILFATMPHLTSIALDTDNNGFAIVCRKWSKLKKLCIYGSSLTDTGVVGIGQKSRPNILKLTDLEVFRFESPELTEHSLVNGLLKLPRLKRIVKGAAYEQLEWESGAISIARHVKGIEIFGIISDRRRSIPPKDDEDFDFVYWY